MKIKTCAFILSIVITNVFASEIAPSSSLTTLANPSALAVPTSTIVKKDQGRNGFGYAAYGTTAVILPAAGVGYRFTPSNYFSIDMSFTV